MSSWRDNEEPPADYLDLLFVKKEESDDEDKITVDLMYVKKEESEDEEDMTGDILYIKKESGDEEMSGGRMELRFDEVVPHNFRDRSRSPIEHCFDYLEPDVVVQVVNENEVRLDEDNDDTLAPDAHAMCVSPEERDRSERRDRKEKRMSGRSGISARGRGRPSQGRRENIKWEVGDPLNEIWTTDEDIPSELAKLAKEVVRRKQIRLLGDRADSNSERSDDSESENDDVFFEAFDGADNLPRLENENHHFEWSPMDVFYRGQEEIFRTERTGSVHCYSSAYDAFRSYWDDDVLGLIVTQTNRYATKIHSDAFRANWVPTNIHEILCLFTFWTMLGIIKMPTISSCFSVDPLLKTEVFRRIFTRRRYEVLTRALNFADLDSAFNESSQSASLDEIHCLRPIITHLNSKFQSNYVLDENICIDVSLTHWKGKLNIKRRIPSKAAKTAKVGIKTFELCESTTGYLWSFIVYTGKQFSTDVEQVPGVRESTAVVKKLMGPLLNKGYRLFMDNWFNSPVLARYLKLNGTDCVGTLGSSCKDIPVVLNKAPLKRGEYIARRSGEVSVLSWQDQERITMISTYHGSSTALSTVPSRPTLRSVPFKPQMVLDYNKFKGGVHLKDQMLEPYLLERNRTGKWYMKLFKHILNISILNSRILLQSSTQKHQDHFAFRLQLVDSVLTNHLSLCPQSRKLSASRGKFTQQPGRYIVSTHWPVLLQPSEAAAARNRHTWKRCVICISEGKKNQRTPYCCESCLVPLCIRNCFKSYHTPK